jgi:psp operon transcriptional activator
MLSRVAKVDRPVLLIGERGTGKELAAARLHFLSRRWECPLVTLNCAALAQTLVESELFGYEAGAFTGAQKRRIGRFELASDGSLFLDEIGQIPMQVQEKILRVVEYGTFERVGGNDQIETEARLIAATNVDLSARAREGTFKADLLDRLSFEVLAVPPLRERRSDIPLLALHFAERMARELEMPAAPSFSDSALRALIEYPWPGNIRELKNVVERAVYACEDAEIRRIRFDPFDHPFIPRENGNRTYGDSNYRATEGERGIDATGDGLEPLPQGGLAPEAAKAALGRRIAFARDVLQSGDLKQGIMSLEEEVYGLAMERARQHQGRAAELLGLTYHQFRALRRRLQKA